MDRGVELILEEEDGEKSWLEHATSFFIISSSSGRLRVCVCSRKTAEKETNGQNPIISHCKIEYVTIVREFISKQVLLKKIFSTFYLFSARRFDSFKKKKNMLYKTYAYKVFIMY